MRKSLKEFHPLPLMEKPPVSAARHPLYSFCKKYKTGHSSSSAAVAIAGNTGLHSGVSSNHIRILLTDRNKYSGRSFPESYPQQHKAFPDHCIYRIAEDVINQKRYSVLPEKTTQQKFLNISLYNEHLFPNI